MRFIRYANRKLYSPVTHSYVKASEVARLVAKGHDVSVECSYTGEDLTRMTLLNVLATSKLTNDQLVTVVGRICALGGTSQ